MTDSDFEDKLKQRLRTSSEELDAATLSRLNQARQRALDELAASPRRFGAFGTWLPAGAVAVAAVFAVLLWQGRLPGTGGTEFPREFVSAAALSDSASLEMELLLHEEDLAMFEELEFYVALTDVELEAAG